MCSVAREVASSPWDESEAAADTDGVPGLAGEEFVQLMGSLAPAFLLAHGEWAIREIFRGCLPLAESYETSQCRVQYTGYYGRGACHGHVRVYYEYLIKIIYI